MTHETLLILPAGTYLKPATGLDLVRKVYALN